MTVSNVDAGSGSAAGALQSAAQQAKANFEKLQQDIQAGNLAGAQQAFAALQQNGPLGQTNPLQKQIDALGRLLDESPGTVPIVLVAGGQRKRLPRGIAPSRYVSTELSQIFGAENVRTAAP